MKTLVLIGGSGFIGKALGKHFLKLGWNIKNFTRKKKDPSSLSYPCQEVEWDGKKIHPKDLEGSSAIINLAGQGIADKTWSQDYKEKILSSRVESTRALAEALKFLQEKPPIVIQASAIGYYGLETRDKICTETSKAGSDFLATTCLAWEKEAEAIKEQTNLIITRFGLVLGNEGGAFKQLKTIYRFALGGILGDGTQWTNWIHLKDVVLFIEKAVQEESFKGTYNLVAPGNLRNKDFHKALAKKTLSFSLMWTPGFLLKGFLGERANLLLKSPQVKGERTEDSYRFSYPHLKEALNDLLA